jgi:hypothetical protein
VEGHVANTAGNGKELGWVKLDGKAWLIGKGTTQSKPKDYFVSGPCGLGLVLRISHK